MASKHKHGVPSRASLARHPIHPILIPFPIAFLAGALLTDMAHWRNRDPFWARASRWLVGAGLVTGSIAAIFGLVDFLSIKRARKYTAGWIHFLGNASVLVLTLMNLILRLRKPTYIVLPWGLALSAITNGILTVTGWFGGELAYRHMIGVTGDARMEEPTSRSSED